LVIYGTSKAALSTYTQGLASEFPSLRVSEVLVGPTAGTEVADHFDPELFGELLPKWFEQGFVRYDMLQVEDVASTIIDALEDEAPPSRVMATGTEGTQTVDEVIRMVPEDQRPSDPRLTGMQREQ
jgi:nucleoside-diphosphate-sugar epimerase